MKDNTFAGLAIKSAATLDEACAAFGLDRPVEKRPLYYPDGEGIMLLSPFSMQTVDVETDKPLGVVGVDYRVVPYREAFSPAEILIENGATIVGGGAPHNGQVAYLVMEAPGLIKFGKHEIRNRFLMRSSHDGTTKVEARCTPFLTANGIALTIDATRPLAFKHTPNVGNRIATARKTFRRVNENWNEFSSAVQKMVMVKLDDEHARGFIDACFPSKTESKRMENIKDDVFTLFKNTGQARVLPQCRGTLFGVVQAIAEWADVHRTVRKSKKRDDVAARLDARLISDAAKKKQKSWALALYMANNGSLKGAGVAGI